VTEAPTTKDPQSPRDQLSVKLERARKRRAAAEGVWYIGLAVLAVVVLLSAGIVIAASQPAVCAACHGDVHDSLEDGTHAEVTCEVCHSGSTAVGVLEGRLAVVNMVVSSAIPRAIAVESNVPSARCLECHSGDMTGVASANKLLMDHEAPLAAGWECRHCHPDAGHAVAGIATGYTMDMCLSCHTTNPVNLATCDICHADGGGGGGGGTGEAKQSPWRVTHGPNWEQTHGMGDLDTCSGCHAAGYCVRCHGQNVPHPEKYLRDHGKDVLSREDGRTLCNTCHTESSCDDCHGTQMPHPDDILKAHADEVTEGGEALKQTCYRCHQEQSCEGCHARHTHPGISAEQRDALTKNPVR